MRARASTGLVAAVLLVAACDTSTASRGASGTTASVATVTSAPGPTTSSPAAPPSTTFAPTATTTVDPMAPLPELPDMPPPGPDRLAWAEELRRLLDALPGAPVKVAIDDAGDAVEFSVRADRVDLAHDVRDRFGDNAAVRLGDQRYPTAATIWPGTTCPWAIAEGPRAVRGLRAAVTLATPTVASGGELDAKVRVTNAGRSRARFYADSTLTGFVVRPGTTEVIGVSSRGPALTGSGGDLAPGESKEFDAIIGTTSCDPALGPVLPPGTYEVLVPVDPSPMGSTDANNLVSEPATLVVTA